VQEERNQLAILMKTLKADFAQLEEAKRMQEEENRALKDRYGALPPLICTIPTPTPSLHPPDIS
jgi:hypothetical protein